MTATTGYKTCVRIVYSLHCRRGVCSSSVGHLFSPPVYRRVRFLDMHYVPRNVLGEHYGK